MTNSETQSSIRKLLQPRQVNVLQMLIENRLRAFNRKGWYFLKYLQSGKKGWWNAE